MMGSQIYTRGRLITRCEPLEWRIYKKFSTFTLWVPITPTDLRVGGPTYPKFGMVIDLSSVLDKFLFDFR